MWWISTCYTRPFNLALKTTTSKVLTALCKEIKNNAWHHDPRPPLTKNVTSYNNYIILDVTLTFSPLERNSHMGMAEGWTPATNTATRHTRHTRLSMLLSLRGWLTTDWLLAGAERDISGPLHAANNADRYLRTDGPTEYQETSNRERVSVTYLSFWFWAGLPLASYYDFKMLWRR